MKLFTRLLFLFGLIAFTACSNYKPPAPANLVAFRPEITVKQNWLTKVGDGSKNQALRLFPTINDDKIFASGYDGKIVVINTDNGHKIWSIDTKLNLTSGLASNNNMVFVGSENGKLLALNQANGKVLWTSSLTGEIMATPAVNDKILVVKAENGEVDGFDLQGNRLWSFTNDQPGLMLRASSSPKIYKDTAIVGFASGEIVVLDTNNGQIKWRELLAEGQGSSPVENMVDIDADPVIINNIIYIATYHGRVAALELATGHALWNHEISCDEGLAVDDNHVFVTDENDQVWAFSRKTGEVLWRQTSLSHRDLTAPAIVGNTVVVGDGLGYLHFMAKDDGHFIGRAQIKNSSLEIAPLVINNSLYVYTKNGLLAKFTIG